MPAESSLLLMGLLFVAAGLGWFFARYSQRAERKPGPTGLSADYFRGLNFLLNEQPDKALEVFMRMVEVDNETVETHFALGKLFRRRGEVERAIRIHQNIIARPGLGRAQRDQALYALGEDYMSAGLFDRAEKLFEQLSENGSYRSEALQELTRIYEQEKDWSKAITAHRKLDASSSGSDVVAHYYCELAQQALDRKDISKARQWLRKARSGPQRTIRGALMRGDIARESNDPKLAIRLYKRVVENNGEFVSEVLPRLAQCFAASNSAEGLSRTLAALVKRDPAIREHIAYAAIIDSSIDNPVALDCVREFVRANEPLMALLGSTGFSVDELGDRAVLQRVSGALRELAAHSARYRCQECGFAAGTLYWQCPTCKSWDTIRPVVQLHYDPLLQLSETPRQAS